MVKENKLSSLRQFRKKMVLAKSFWLWQQWKLWTATQGDCGISFTRPVMNNGENYTNITGVIWIWLFCPLKKHGLDDFQQFLLAPCFYSYRQPLQHSSVTQLMFLNPCEHMKLPDVSYELFVNRIYVLYFTLLIQRPNQILFFPQISLNFAFIYWTLGLFIDFFYISWLNLPFCKCVFLS